MGCTSCAKRKQNDNATLSLRSDSASYPLNANDIQVIDSDGLREWRPDDWPTAGQVLLVLIPAAFTPVCSSELAALNKWYDEFEALGCELMVVCSDPPEDIATWIQVELDTPRYKTLSSYLLPARLGLVEDGRAKRSSVFMLADGEVVKQEHFAKVGRSFAELHRMLYGYTTGSYCAEGWKSPEDGFLKGDA